MPVTTRSKKIPHPEFAQRLQQACEANLDVPPPNYGRLGWFKRRLEEKFEFDVTVETVRKWFAGEARPRERPMSYLANLLAVDEAWLAIGSKSEVSKKEQKLRNAAADGVVNVVTGLIQMGGGHPAFPHAGDTRADKERIDLYAVIRGAQYALHVTLGDHRDDGWHFVVPTEAINTVVLGVMPEGMNLKIIELDPEGIEAVGSRKATGYEVIVSDKGSTGDHKWRKIETFSERL